MISSVQNNLCDVAPLCVKRGDETDIAGGRGDVETYTQRMLPQNDAYAVAMMRQLNNERMKNFATSDRRLRQIKQKVRKGKTEMVKLAAMLL